MMFVKLERCGGVVSRTVVSATTHEFYVKYRSFKVVFNLSRAVVKLQVSM